MSHLNLPVHRYGEQGDEIHDENGPKHGHVEHVEEGANGADDSALGDRVPELELGQAAHEWPEFALAGTVSWQFGSLVVVAQIKFGVDFGREERNKQVQMVDAQRVRHYVPALFGEYAEQEEKHQEDCPGPSHFCVWR